MDDDREQLVKSVRILGVVDGIKQSQLERERHAICELDVLAQILLVLEPLQVQREDIRQLLDFHATTPSALIVRGQ